MDFKAALLGKCPLCSQGRLFSGFLKVASECAHCHQDFKAADTGDGPVVFVILIVGAIVSTAFVIVDFNYNWPMWVHLSVWLPLALVLSLGLMRPLKALMLALQLKHKVKDR